MVGRPSAFVYRGTAEGRLYTGRVAPTGEKLIVDNRRARHDYHLLDRVEAGLVLTGTEVKSLREGRASLQQAYAEVRDGEAWLIGAHISEFAQAGTGGHDPRRARKLLLHRREIESTDPALYSLRQSVHVGIRVVCGAKGIADLFVRELH